MSDRRHFTRVPARVALALIAGLLAAPGFGQGLPQRPGEAPTPPQGLVPPPAAPLAGRPAPASGGLPTRPGTPAAQGLTPSQVQQLEELVAQRDALFSRNEALSDGDTPASDRQEAEVAELEAAIVKGQQQVALAEWRADTVSALLADVQSRAPGTPVVHEVPVEIDPVLALTKAVMLAYNTPRFSDDQAPVRLPASTPVLRIGTLSGRGVELIWVYNTGLFYVSPGQVEPETGDRG